MLAVALGMFSHESGVNLHISLSARAQVRCFLTCRRTPFGFRLAPRTTSANNDYFGSWLTISHLLPVGPLPWPILPTLSAEAICFSEQTNERLGEKRPEKGSRYVTSASKMYPSDWCSRVLARQMLMHRGGAGVDCQLCFAQSAFNLPFWLVFCKALPHLRKSLSGFCFFVISFWKWNQYYRQHILCCSYYFLRHWICLVGAAGLSRTLH